MSTRAVAGRVDEASRWIYQGVWSVLVRWFRVPDQPPELPVLPGESAQSFRPSVGFLRYLKLQFWVLLALIDGAIAIGWLVIAVASPVAGAVLALPALAVAVLPDIAAYVAIHLRYDTTWYVMTSRSLRIRRGIWIIHETTITFENVQNVEVNQGPIQRWFGIANVRVETAGGGAGKDEAHKAHSGGHRGLIEGVSDAARIRDLILVRLKQSRAAGLGDEPAAGPRGRGWTREQIVVLREIRDLARELVAGGSGGSSGERNAEG